MRQIILIFGVLFALNHTSYANSKTNYLNMFWQDTTDAKTIIEQLEKKFKVHITYESDILSKVISKNGKLALQAKNIDDAFNILFKSSALTYKKIRNDFYVIVELKTNTNDTTVIYTGSVFDNNQIPLPGANVLITGTQKATITNLDGNFVLKAGPSAKSLSISFLGYKTQRIDINGKTNFSVKLAPEFIGLDEVIVSGVAGRTPAKKLTVTVAKVTADQLNEAPASSAATSLQGKVAGVKVVQPSGAPGSSSDITLRGATSLNGNNAPLIMVDGNVFESSMADINVDDIKSMEIVKGAAASALYGSKAGNGVVNITTYRGNELSEGKTKIKMRNELGFSTLPNQIALSESHPYELAEDAADYDFYTKYNGVRYDSLGNVIRGSRRLDDDHFADNPYGVLRNFQDEFYNNGRYYTNYISMSNNTGNTNTFISFENNKQSGIVFATDGYTRQNFRVNVDHRLNEKLKLSTSNLLINSKTDKPGSDGGFFDLLFLDPDVDLEQANEDGSPYKIDPDPWSLEENPLYPLYYRERKEKRTSLLSNFKVNYSPVSWFNLEGKYTIEMRFRNWTTYTPRGYLYGGGSNILGSIYKEQYRSNYQTAQATANFYKKFDQLIVKGKLSYLYEDKTWYDFSATGREIVIADIAQLNNTDPTKATLNSYEGIIRSENIFGIADLDYKDRYLLSFLLRRDGSSLFGENNRYANYYRFSAAYRISEDFKIPGVNELKIRFANGGAGQRPSFSDQYEFVSVDNYGNVYKDQIGNQNLKPAKSIETEFALDAYLVNRINFQTSYSLTNTEDAILHAPNPPHMGGFNGIVNNVASLNSASFEATLGVKILDTKDFKWHVNVMFDRIRQKINKLNVPEYKTGPLNAFYMRSGEPIGIIYGYKWITSLDEMSLQLPTGTTIADYEINSDGYVIPVGTQGTINEIPVLYDADNNGVADLTKIGDGNADFNLGFSTNFSWKGFQFYALIDWKKGGDVYNYTHQYTFRDHRAIEFDQAGKAESEKKTIEYYSTFYHHTSVNSYFIEDGSYVKLRELSIYYNLPKKWLTIFNDYVSLVRLGAIGHNLYTLTSYSGYDPEVTAAGNNNLTQFPFDNFSYPNFRTFKFSLEINF